MKTSIKKVKKANMYVLTCWKEEKQGVKQTQQWFSTVEEAKKEETKMLES